MALFMKQDFTPPILSRKWLAIKLRPNMLIYNREHIISILESGLLFREDSAEVEDETPSPEEVRAGAGGGWLTRGEGRAAAAGLAVCVLACPPRSLNRSALIHVALYASVPVVIRTAHRSFCRGELAPLLRIMREYLALARRAAACIRDCSVLQNELNSISSVLESTETLLCRQQSALTITLQRASTTLLGNIPWLAHINMPLPEREQDKLMKIHHTFLVIQSTFLKHVAMVHYIPPAQALKLYKNYNERIYWIHKVLLKHITQEFHENYEALERMYRILKNYGNTDVNIVRKPGHAIKDNWLYSDVHGGVAKACLEIKMAANKCNNLDVFLDSCALQKQEIDLRVLNKDIDDIIDKLTKCLSTVQSSQIRLKKLQNKFAGKDERNADVPETDVIEVPNYNILKIEDKDPETKDEVFYFIKTGDNDNAVQSAGDIVTGPGKKERETTKIVLNELRRKLVKREDVMRERERQALVKTMPEFKNRPPEFPRQINMEEVLDRKGYISKLKRLPRKRLFRKYKIHHSSRRNKKYKLVRENYTNDEEIKANVIEANSDLKNCRKLISISSENYGIVLTQWLKSSEPNKYYFDSSGMSDGLSDVEGSAVNKTVHEATNKTIDNRNGHGDGARNFKFTKKELELSPSSDSDLDFYDSNLSLLKDVRRHRVVRKKSFPAKKVVKDKEVDESLKPVEYNFGTGLAMASVLQVNGTARFPCMAQEEVFIGDGEVSEDSGNDEDA